MADEVDPHTGGLGGSTLDALGWGPNEDGSLRGAGIYWIDCWKRAKILLSPVSSGMDGLMKDLDGFC